MDKKLVISIILAIIILFCYVMLIPLFQPGFFPMHDDTQVARVYEMTKTLSEWVFPVRTVPDLGYGYGYPIFNFYAPFAYYVGSIYDLLGVDELWATKLMIFTPIVILSIGMYALSSRFFGKVGGLISALLVVGSPYIALNIFVRGAISELYGLSFIPWIFFFMYLTYVKKRFRYVVLGSISFALLVSSHNLTTLIITPFILVFASILGFLYYKQSQKQVSFYLLLLIFLGVVLSGFYWIPAIFEMNSTNVSSQIGGGADFRDHFVCLNQLWDSPWGYGGSAPGCLDGMSFRIGKLHIFLLLVSLPLAFFVKERKTRYAIWGGLFLFVSAVFLSLSISQFVWENTIVLKYIQYPWRYVGIMSLSSAFVIGSIVSYIRMGVKRVRLQKYLVSGSTVFIVLGILVLYMKLFQPSEILNVKADYYTNSERIRFDTSKLSDEYLPKSFLKPKEKMDIPSELITEEDVSFQVLSDKPTETKLSIHIGDETNILVHRASFPWWHVFIDNKEVSYRSNSRGMVISLPQGTHEVTISYKNTSIQTMANTLSVVGILALIIGIIHERKRHLL